MAQIQVKRELLDSKDLRNVDNAAHNIHSIITKKQNNN
jgi:hypothetical protein